jgi:molybdenum cofactor cytidylyltransferase
MIKSVDNIGLILLAAGASRRLGKPKQSLQFEGETLLRRAVKTALASDCQSVIVVLGANAEKLELEIEEFDAHIIKNPDWERGMGTSIQIGLEELLKRQPKISGVILAVCDQPFVSVGLLKQLTENFRLTNAPIIACAYGETLGVPTLFSRNLFSELLTLKADNGAKKIIYKHREKVIKIPFEAGALDIDTEQDYLNLIESDKFTAS